MDKSLLSPQTSVFLSWATTNCQQVIKNFNCKHKDLSKSKQKNKTNKKRKKEECNSM